MKIKIKRVYKPERNTDPIIAVDKVLDSGNIASYEESYVFPNCVEVSLYTGEVFIVEMLFTEFDKLIDKCDLEDAEKEKRRDLGF